MKTLLIILLFPMQLLAQDISGVWTGTLYNDTTRQYFTYQLAINNINGKLSGYSYTIFIIDSIKNIGVKTIKIKKKNDKYFVEDEKLIYNNYKEPPAKGVRTFSALSYSANDTLEFLKGSFTTNWTREYSAVTGNIFLQKKKQKFKETLIIAKLEELSLLNKLSFIQDEKNSNVAISSVAINKDKSIEEITILPAEKNNNDQTETGQKKDAIVSAEKNKAPISEKNKERDHDKNENVSANKPPEEVAKVPDQNPSVALNENKSSIEKKEVVIAEKNKETDRGKSANVSNSPSQKEITKDQNPSVALNENKSIEKKEVVIAEKNKETDRSKSANVSSGLSQKEIAKDQNPSVALNENKSIEKKEVVIAEKNKETDRGKNANVSSSLSQKEIAKDQNQNPSVALNENKQPEKKEIVITEKNKNLKIEDEQKKIRQEKSPAAPSEITKKLSDALKETKTLPAAVDIAKRKIETIETVEIKQDSLVLSLFDNGIVDGDTVSILINGKVIWPRVGLLEKATNKTIYLTPDMGDSILVVMYAESLGNIPPNTGLLLVRDGKINHEIRFSGDLKKNSAIILKRKKN